MHRSSTPSGRGLHRYSAHRNVKPVHFVCEAPKAEKVGLLGDFNNWNADEQHPMVRRQDGKWSVEIPLCHGHHRYVFLVDGARTLDPHAMGIARDDRNERVSLMSVS